MSERIEPEDLEAELRRTVGDAEGRAADARHPLIAGAVVTVVVLVGVAFLVGRRLGRRASTTVEIRRI
jgi:hypothetical protein